MAAAMRAAPVSVLLELNPDGIWCGQDATQDRRY
jgi:hypothetical protein